MSSSYPEEWSVHNLGDIVSFQTGRLNSNAARSNGKYPFFTCSPESLRTDTYSFDTECVLLAGNNAAGVFSIKYFTGKFDAYQRTYIIRANDNAQLDNRFLFYALQPKLELLQRYSIGSATQYLTLKILRGIEFHLPTIKEQKEIASTLSHIDQTMQTAQASLVLTEKLKIALLQRLLTRGIGHARFKKTEIGEIPEEWAMEPIVGIAECINGYPFKPSDWGTSGLPIIRIQQLNNENAGFDYFSGEIDTKYRVHDGDILFSWSGTLGAYLWNGGDAYLNQHIFKVIPYSGVNRMFLLFLLQYIIPKLALHSHGSTMKHIRRGVLDLFRVPIPPKSEQQEIAAMLESVDRMISLGHHNRKAFEELKKGLMQVLFTGKVRVKM